MIGNPLEAKVVIRASGEVASLLQRHQDDLRYICIVFQVEVHEAPDATDSLRIEVLKADGQKCERCWNYSVQVEKDTVHPTLCERCVPAVRD